MMIRAKVEGREATIVYINERFEPVSDKEATRAKILFDDGEIWFMKLDSEKTMTTTLHVYEQAGNKMAQIVVNGSTYQIGVTPEIAALGVGEHQITMDPM